jgi:hypothetical protein
MIGLCESVISDFGDALGVSALVGQPWYLVAGRAGRNAALKIVLPPLRWQVGYVLTVARQKDTRVVGREVEILRRLASRSRAVAEAVPHVLVHGSVEGYSYFGVPFYKSCGHGRLTGRLMLNKRIRWVTNWTQELAVATRALGISRDLVEAGYRSALSAACAESAVPIAVKRRIARNFDLICEQAAHIPSVCCHGDLWAGNVLWQRNSTRAIILDWGAANWPGLPGVDLCRFLLANTKSDDLVAASVLSYCRAIGLSPDFVPALYDMYNLFVKAELDEAFRYQQSGLVNPFTETNDQLARRLSRALGETAEERVDFVNETPTLDWSKLDQI